MPFIVTSRVAGSKAARVVPTAASTRPQLGSLPKTAHLKRLLRATARATSSASSTLARRAHLDGDVVGGALGVGDELPREARAHRRQGRRQLVAAHRHPGRPGGEHDDGVVGRHAGVGVDAVEGDGRRGAQGRVEVGGIDDGVGGEHDEHRRESRREHAGALGHAGDRPALAGVRRHLVHACRSS